MALLDEPQNGGLETPSLSTDQDVVRSLATGYSIEVVPFQVPKALNRLAMEARTFEVFIPYLPDADYGSVIEATRTIAAEGHHPVPHLTARSLKDRADLQQRLEGLASAGATDLLMIAGDQDVPVGAFEDVRSVIETGVIKEIGFERFAIGGHPDGHPRVRPDVLNSHMRDKIALASDMGAELRIVTQFSLTPDTVVSWVKAMRESGIDVPIQIGFPGPVSFKTLMKFAIQLGVATSAKAAFRKPSLLKALTQRWTPGESLLRLAHALPDEVRSGKIGSHVFAFGGIDASVDWFAQVERGAFTVTGSGDTASLVLS